MATDSLDCRDPGTSSWGLEKSSLLAKSSDTLIILFPSVEESRLLVRVLRVELVAQRELSSWVFPLPIFRLPIERKRDRMHGMEAVIMTKYVSIYSHRS